ncbi:acetoacetate decarboxylase family protein [Streptomyces sp. S07_1.15]|uniref:acetoacetate decarboxylase family protein n=1 Tax=Streptomyces sp. S07_1.15 TaxID=2873925 RepID=UPI001D13FE2A|nr:acetoacetate decarboxylase family protein [Streptomyces sp. S07_1.15]MCC3650672.1 acetoacetate decarboxylase family protein [Streptomyces sp. S07_1.15]
MTEPIPASLPSAPRATAMPAYAPLFVAGTERVRVRWLTITYPTDARVLRALLPEQIEPGNELEAAIWVAEFMGAEFTGPGGVIENRPAYTQGGVSVRCTHSGVDSAYAVVTFVEGLNHGILGRELFGLPKKQAREVRLVEDDRTLEAGFTTGRGVQLLTSTVTLAPAAVASRPAPGWFDNHLTLKLIPSAEGEGFDISRLVQIPWSFNDSQYVRRGVARVEWAVDRADPLYILVQNGEATATYGESTLVIGYGRYREHVADFRTFGLPTW